MLDNFTFEFWIAIILVILGVFLFYFGYAYKRYFLNKISVADRKYFQDKWKKIKLEKNVQQKILNADKILDQLLKKRGYQGSVGEKLKQAKGLFSDYNGIWFAHKLRNKVAHEIDFKVNNKDLNQAMSQFEKAFRDLGL